MPRGTGGIRRVVAALLALALLDVPGTPIGHTSPAAPLRQHTVHHCITQDNVAQDPALDFQGQDHDQPGGRPDDSQDLACCASAQCPATVAAPLAPPAQPMAPSGLWFVGITTGVVPDGIAVPPPLHPPRPLA